jgi:hypothetical protein
MRTLAIITIMFAFTLSVLAALIATRPAESNVGFWMLNNAAIESPRYSRTYPDGTRARPLFTAATDSVNGLLEATPDRVWFYEQTDATALNLIAVNHHGRELERVTVGVRGWRWVHNYFAAPNERVLIITRERINRGMRNPDTNAGQIFRAVQYNFATDTLTTLVEVESDNIGFHLGADNHIWLWSATDARGDSDVQLINIWHIDPALNPSPNTQPDPLCTMMRATDNVIEGLRLVETLSEQEMLAVAMQVRGVGLRSRLRVLNLTDCTFGPVPNLPEDVQLWRTTPNALYATLDDALLQYNYATQTATTLTLEPGALSGRTERFTRTDAGFRLDAVVYISDDQRQVLEVDASTTQRRTLFTLPAGEIQWHFWQDEQLYLTSLDNNQTQLWRVDAPDRATSLLRLPTRVLTLPTVMPGTPYRMMTWRPSNSPEVVSAIVNLETGGWHELSRESTSLFALPLPAQSRNHAAERVALLGVVLFIAGAVVVLRREVL